MRYSKPELAVVSQAHLAILLQHECMDPGGEGKSQAFEDFGGCHPAHKSDGAYSVDE